MGRISGGQLLIRALKAEGVEVVFGLPGVAIFSAFDACLKEGLRVIDCRHEAAAVHMAEGYARARRQPAVALVTEGPGHANALPGLASAFAEGVPVLVLGGLPPSQELGKGAVQEMPQVEMARPIAKWSAMVPSLERLPEFLATAFRHLRTGCPGPVHLSLPADVLEGMAAEDSLPILPSQHLGPTIPPGAPPESIDQILALLASAERPLAIAGSAAYWSSAPDALQRLIEVTRIPLLTRDQARGMVSDDHPHCFGTAVRLLNKAADAISQADVVLLLGVKLDSRLAYGGAFASDAALVHIYPDPAEVAKNHPVEVGIAADVGRVVEQLLRAAEGRRWPERSPWLEAMASAQHQQQEELRGTAERGGKDIHPLDVAEALEPHLGEDTLLVLEFANFGSWMMHRLKARRPGRWLVSDALAMQGTGLPYALGAQVALPEARVLLLSGDGAFGFYPMEMDTAVRHRLPVVAVVGNDAAWGIEEHLQRALLGRDRPPATSLRPSRYDQMVEAMGGHGERVQRIEELEPALARAFGSGRPACVNVTIQNPPSPLVAAVSHLLAQRRAQTDHAEG